MGVLNRSHLRYECAIVGMICVLSVTMFYVLVHKGIFIVKGNGRVHELRDLEEAVVKNIYGQSIKVKDVATVQIGAADKIGDGSLNASPSVVLTISKQPDVNQSSAFSPIVEAVSDGEITSTAMSGGPRA